MLNQFIVIGRLRKIIDLGENKGALITIENSRPFKNADGIYETDLIGFRIFDGVKNSMIEYCKENDIIGIKGRIQTRNEEIGKITELIGEKITFLSSKSEGKKENE